MITQKEQEKLNRQITLNCNLYCYLRKLKQEILAGDKDKLVEFQQYIQFAPQETRDLLIKT